MITKLTEAEFIERYGDDAYTRLTQNCYNIVKPTKEFTKFMNDGLDAAFASVMAIDKLNNDKKPIGVFLIEVNAKKIPLTSDNKLFGIDFGIVALSESDEDMPDEALDRYNVYKTAKENNQPPS